MAENHMVGELLMSYSGLLNHWLMLVGKTFRRSRLDECSFLVDLICFNYSAVAYRLSIP